jgi:ribosomal protein S18 acetylase RimI-like enzyme
MTDAKYTIRPAAADDADTLTALKVRMGDQHHAYKPDIWRPGAETEAGWRKELAELLADEKAEVFVAEAAEGQVVGCISCGVFPAPYEQVAATCGKVGELMILPDHRRVGLGRRLMEIATDWLKHHGAENVLLHVAAKNEPALRFYEALGFRSTNYRMYKKL